MAEQDRAGEADRFAHGTGRTEKHEAEKDSFRPGEYGGGQRNVPGTAPASAQGADREEGTEGAVGEMDFTGSPAGPGVAGAGPQSIEATTAALGDMEPSAGSGGASRTDDDKDA